MEIVQAKGINDRWLAKQLRPYGVKPGYLRFGDRIARGYVLDDFKEVFRRYISRTDLDNLVQPPPEEGSTSSSST
jgi:hypothetical protein